MNAITPKWNKGDPYPTKANRHLRDYAEPAPNMKVVITDIDVPFLSITGLIFKTFFAAALASTMVWGLFLFVTTMILGR